ncbi:MAG: RICIN domain-containing protein [Cryobacterium sp.]|nr:RICIN domain-containing protein [Oligoflexia bacterium]
MDSRHHLLGLFPLVLTFGMGEAFAALPTSAVPLISRNSGKCLTITGEATTDGAGTSQVICTSSSAQQFKLNSAGTGVYYLANSKSSKCLDVENASMNAGALVKQYSCGGGANQKFIVRPSAVAGYYEIVASHSSQCIGVVGSSLSSGAVIQQSACAGSSSQQWSLGAIPATAPAAPAAASLGTLSRIGVSGSNKCLDVSAGSSANLAAIVQNDCNLTASEKFTFRSVGNSLLEIVSNSSSKCLDVNNASNADGAVVQQYSCSGGGNQRFRVVLSASSAQFQVVASHSGKCIEVKGSSLANGASLQQMSCSNASNQFFLSDQVKLTVPIITPSPSPAPVPVPSPSPVAVPAPTTGSPSSALAISGLTLINASRNADQPLDGVIGHSARLANLSVLNLGVVGVSLNIKAEIRSAGSVVFDLDNGALVHTENVAPYAFASDTNGVYNSWTPSVGSHTLKVTAYSAGSGSGTSGTPIIVQFTVLAATATLPNPVPSSVPTPTSPPVGGAPSPAEPSNYSGPIIITQGGIYSGNWRSPDSDTVAVTVNAGSAPVIIENCHIAGPGRLIQGNGSNLTVRNCYFHGKPPSRNGAERPRAITNLGFKNLVVEHNYFEHVSKAVGVDYYSGDGSASQALIVRYNRVRNIDGRLREGGAINANFVAVQNFHGSGGNPRFSEIAWNDVQNTPFDSSSEDLINFYSAGGRSDSWFKVHDNLLKGSYAVDPANQPSSGSGMIVDGDQTLDSNTKTGFIESYNNTVLNTTNAGMNISAGHDIHYHDNRVISSGRLPDGRCMPGNWAGVAVWNTSSPGSGINQVMNGNVLGWAKCGYNNPYIDRNDMSTNEKGSIRDNIILPNAPITYQMEVDEINLYLKKVSDQGIVIGPVQ